MSLKYMLENEKHRNIAIQEINNSINLEKWWSNSIDKSVDGIHVIIDQPTIDGLKIVNSPFIGVKNFEFRPQTWEQFIGQSSAKNRALTIVKQFKRGMRSHVVLSAIRGHGKTSFVRLLSKDLNANLIERIGKQINENNFVDLLNEINSSQNPNVVLFIDEIDTMDKAVIKIFNSVIESFQIAGKNIKPFLFACASINKGTLLKNNPDFLDRIQHHITFSRYTKEELGTIISQYHQQLYKEENIDQEDIQKIAINCKYNPRTAINLLENLIVNTNLDSVMLECGIIKNGLTNIDVKILKILSEQKRPMGSNAIAMRCGLSEPEYLRDYEAFLYEFSYLNRIPSRVITEKGLQFLKGCI